MNPGLIEFLFAFAVGLCATLVMTLIEIPLWKRFGLRGVLEWHENQILSARFFRLSNDTMHFKGIFLLHFLNGGLGGVGFLLVWWLLPVIATSVIPSGIAYGMFLWVVTLIPIHKPITGISPWKHPDGITPVIMSLAGHLIYGVIVGLCIVTFS